MGHEVLGELGLDLLLLDSRVTGHLLRNDGRGAFTAAPPGLLPGIDLFAQRVTAADLDGDGDDPDSLWLNLGGGVLTDASGNLPPFASFGGLLFDADRDGRVDLLRLGFELQLALGLPAGGAVLADADGVAHERVRRRDSVAAFRRYAVSAAG